MKPRNSAEKIKQTHISLNFRDIVEDIEYYVIILFSYIFRILIFAIKTPIFILSYIKNFISVLLGSIVLYTIGFIVYYSLFTNISPADAKFTPSDVWFYPFVIFISIMAFIATIGQFSDN
ncbi:hypothetical protein RYR35_000877 [Streptococcus iniae]|uniref:hypothetical protein n=1 Tax=Streptococcus parauberis TaxID=1348 RepID=UPI0009785EC4|nr:hypothetical protein [Streptococcus parauberis]ELY5747650.1 hypothetical protein [Streptococcus iniae]MSU87448.1 hypothetical protein [Streptococcus dysgalactiae subsp. dysgalactiae]ONH62970.1 hypothetical protein ASN87_01709 [Streptococcus parauberis]PCH14560.1 hypothetical protein A9Y58_00059 [Streptococcus parauberis]PNY21520.1 hypothetical protein ASN88_01188 [Streptococcus parauberis]